MEETNQEVQAQEPVVAAETQTQEAPEITTDDIAAAVSEVVSAEEQPKEEPKEEPHEEAQKAKESKPDNHDAPPAEISSEDRAKFDAIIERGVRAGLSMQDILAMPNAEFAERMVATAEKAAGISPTNKETEQDGAGKEPADELGKTIEEMEQDGGYDANMLKMLKGLYAENKSLKASRDTEAKKTFFDTQFGGLDESVRSHVDAVRKSQLKSTFDMLKAGHAAQGDKATDEQVFQEAAKLALGDLMGKAAEERKAAAISQRRNLILARPGGENGHRKAGTPASEEDIAAQLCEAFNI